jgi:hypothetical protein
MRKTPFFKIRIQKNKIPYNNSKERMNTFII